MRLQWWYEAVNQWIRLAFWTPVHISGAIVHGIARAGTKDIIGRGVKNRWIVRPAEAGIYFGLNIQWRSTRNGIYGTVTVVLLPGHKPVTASRRKCDFNILCYQLNAKTIGAGRVGALVTPWTTGSYIFGATKAAVNRHCFGVSGTGPKISKRTVGKVHPRAWPVNGGRKQERISRIMFPAYIRAHNMVGAQPWR